MDCIVHVFHDARMLCVTDSARYRRPRRGIGLTVCKSAIPGDAGSAQSVDVCRQWGGTGPDCLAFISQRPSVSGRSGLGRAVRKGPSLERPVFPSFRSDLGARLRGRLFITADLFVVRRWGMIAP